jgi:hypothetical protein
MGRGRVVPAVVAASGLINGEIIASTCRTLELAALVAWFKLVEVVQNGK